ncbi:hypothetical protein FH972_021601 [Carpinus fangiana]|uniref:Uncharacterized protein n=1 Tax=Carpinus fangiana TaxID=176857 RepID=A0A5N6KQD0_9ROSI|nr:hypothetical protein FH972_021601 [Carpinus fangiana]
MARHLHAMLRSRAAIEDENGETCGAYQGSMIATRNFFYASLGLREKDASRKY